MVWICPVCSSNNEDSEKFCLICENERPRSFDKEKKHKKRIEATEAFYKQATAFYKKLFIALLCATLLCIVGQIVLKIINNEIQSVLDNLLSVLKSWGNVAKGAFKDNALAVGEALIDEPLPYVYKNFLSVMKHFGGSFKNFGLSFWEVLKHFGGNFKDFGLIFWGILKNFGGNFKDFGISVAAVAVTFWGHVKDFWTILSGTVSQWWSRVEDFGEIVKECALNIWRHLKGAGSIIKEVALRFAENVKDFYIRIKDLFA